MAIPMMRERCRLQCCTSSHANATSTSRYIIYIYIYNKYNIYIYAPDKVVVGDDGNNLRQPPLNPRLSEVNFNSNVSCGGGVACINGLESMV